MIRKRPHNQNDLTVGKLIELLQQFDSDALVFTVDDSCTAFVCDPAKQVTRMPSVDCKEYGCKAGVIIE